MWFIELIMSFIWLYKLPLTFDFRSRPQEAVECLFSNCLIKKRRNHEICPMERNRNSGIREIFANEMWNPWLWNPKYSSGNWNLESRCLADKEPGIHSWNLDSRMQDSLRFLYMRRMKQKNLSSRILLFMIRKWQVKQTVFHYHSGFTLNLIYLNYVCRTDANS